MDTEVVEQMKKDFEEAEMVLIGVGNGASDVLDTNSDKIEELINILEAKNYFIISSLKKNKFDNLKVNRKRLSNPLLIELSQDNDERECETKQWDFYNKWLSCTLNKKLLILELGEGFNTPNIFRWPFEKITLINQKAKMYRVNDEFPQIPEDISGKAVSIKESVADFLSAF